MTHSEEASSTSVLLLNPRCSGLNIVTCNSTRKGCSVLKRICCIRANAASFEDILCAKKFFCFPCNSIHFKTISRLFSEIYIFPGPWWLRLMIYFPLRERGVGEEEEGQKKWPLATLLLLPALQMSMPMEKTHAHHCHRPSNYCENCDEYRDQLSVIGDEDDTTKYGRLL